MATLRQKTCTHLSELTEIKVSSNYFCEECLKTGDDWLHLRICQTCGVTLCCDSSSNQHATKHFHLTEHAVIASAEPGERWLWCYVDKQIAAY